MIANVGLLAESIVLWGDGLPLLSIYIVCLVAGGGMLLLSSLFGGHAGTDVPVDGGFDFSGDVHAELPSDVNVDPSGGADGAFDSAAGHGHEWFSLTSWFSVSFVVYFLATFGLVGTSLTLLSDIPPHNVVVLAVAIGLAAGQSVHQLLRFLRRTSGNSASTAAEYVNRPARVTLAINDRNKGEVAVCIRGETRFIPAVSRQAGHRFEKGESVFIVDLNEATAEVVAEENHVTSAATQTT